MVSHRGGYTIEQHKVRGIALVSVLIISVIILVLMGGLYFMLTRLFETAEATRTYSSAREAAVAGVNYALASGVFDIIENLENCPDGKSSVKKPTDNDYNEYKCPEIGDGANRFKLACRFTINFRLRGTSQIYQNTVTVCFLGPSTSGYPITGVAHSRPIPGNKGNIYSIISEVRDPQGRHTARIEAVYAP